jgi:putative FmdB family regulatory protein
MTYEYVCEACGHQWEAEQSIKDSPLKTCVSCAASKAKRLVSGGTGFLLKGGGWYADLYSSAGAAKAPDEKAGGKSAKTEGADAKPASDSKSDTSTGGDGKAAGAKTPSSASAPSSPASPASTGSGSSSAAASAKAS